MSHIKSVLLSGLVGLSLYGCGAVEPDSPPVSVLRLATTNDGVTTALPSRVSVSFTVDTFDGQPVAGLSSDAFDIFEDGARVSPYESQRAIQPRGEKSRMYTLMLLDLSGSILRSGEFPKVQAAASAFVDGLLAGGSDSQRIAIYGFDGRSNLLPIADFSADAASLKAALQKLSDKQCSTNADCAGQIDAHTCAGFMCVDDSTNLNGAIVTGLSTLDAAVAAETTIPFKESALMVFTDGTDEAARVSASDTDRAISQSRSHVFTVGLGGDVDVAALTDFGRDGYAPVASSDELSQAFAQIASRISAMANRFYVLDYCSPKRSGTHELKIAASITRADGSLLSGTLTRSFSAEGFASGCTIDQTPTAP